MMKIIYPREELEKAIPALNTVRGEQKTVTFQQWDNRIKTIETKNLKKYGHSITTSGLAHYMNPCVICMNDGTTITFDAAKYKLIREYLMSEQFANRD